MFVCFDKEVGWCVGIAVILVVGRGEMRRSRWMRRLRCCWERSPKIREGYQCLIPTMPKCEGY